MSSARYEKHNARRREDRKQFRNIEAYMCKDYKYKDKKAGFAGFDLTKEIIKELIKDGCDYCGESPTKIRMTLDRIDNTKGHISSNVIPACYRCNVMRGTMPYKAWLELVPTIRSVREKGLFDDWNGRNLVENAGFEPAAS